MEFLLKEYPEIEAIFHDCDIPGNSPNVHASYEQLKKLDADIRKKLFICHYNSSVDSLNLEKDGFAGCAKSGIYYDF